MSDSAPRFLNHLKTRSWTYDELKKAGLSRPQWDLLEGLEFVSAAHGSIVAPAGMVTDLASIPRAAFAYISPDDPAIEYPSVIHDYLYRARGAIPGIAEPLSREQVDRVLIEGMSVCGARADQRTLVFWAVRMFGGSHWGDQT